jgi:RsmE family RNA methyltransferase
MKQHRFFVKQEFEDLDEVSISDLHVIHQIKNVLRLKTGDKVILINDSNEEFHGEIKTLTKKFLKISGHSVYLVSRGGAEETRVKLHLFISLIKKRQIRMGITEGY